MIAVVRFIKACLDIFSPSFSSSLSSLSSSTNVMNGQQSQYQSAAFSLTSILAAFQEQLKTHSKFILSEISNHSNDIKSINNNTNIKKDDECDFVD